jgi:hypothetical protein
MVGEHEMIRMDAGLLISHTFLVFGVIFPIWAVLRLRVFGLFTGAAFVWILGFLNISIVCRIDSPGEGTMFGVLTSAWLVSGWIICLVYSGLIYILSLPFYKKLRTKPSDDAISPESPQTTPNWRYIVYHLYPIERMVLAVVIVFNLVMYFLCRLR